MDASRAAAARGLAPWLVIAAIVVVADQLAKARVQALLLVPGNTREVTGFFNLSLAYNRGAAFSFLNDAAGWQGPLFALVAVVASAVIIWVLAGHWRQRLLASALALVLGGAVGNLVDRLRYGHVVDFLDFHWTWLDAVFPGGHFPAFNVADSAITGGAILLVLVQLQEMIRPAAQGKA
jgi:signal peptidase II